MQAARLLIALVAWPLAVAACAAALLSQGGRVSERLDVLTHFAPLYLVAAVAAIVLGLVGPRAGRPVLIVVAAVGAVGAAALIAPEYLGGRDIPTAPPGAPGEIKIIQFNAWGGNRQVDEAVRWLLDQDPDVIVLEEGGKLRNSLLAAGYHASCKGCSAAVLSKSAPIETYAEPTTRSQASYISASVLEDELGPYTVVAVHRHWPTRFAEDRVQTGDLKAYLATQPSGRLILAGDFNSTPWSFARRREDREFGLIRRTRALFSWPAARLSHNRLPAPFPWLPIDHLYAGRGWATVSVRRGPAIGSDHYPVVVFLAPRSPRPPT